jgi:hypothetical protein
MANLYPVETRRGTAGVNGLQIATLIGDLSQKVAIRSSRLTSHTRKRKQEFATCRTRRIRCWRGA